MHEHDEIIHDQGYTKYILRHYVNKLGKERIWGLIQNNVFGPGALVLPFTREHEVILERSYRIPLQGYVIELPGGSNDVLGEESVDIAKRELKEETGFINGEYHLLCQETQESCTKNDILH